MHPPTPKNQTDPTVAVVRRMSLRLFMGEDSLIERLDEKRGGEAENHVRALAGEDASEGDADGEQSPLSPSRSDESSHVMEPFRVLRT